MDDMYREYILEHYSHPQNFGEPDSYTITMEGKNPTCGDQLVVYITLSEDGETLTDIKFTGEGCAISQAAMSMLSEEVIGKKIADIEQLDRDYMTDMVGIELSAARIKCAVLGLVATKMGLAEATGSDKPSGWDGMDELAWEG